MPGRLASTWAAWRRGPDPFLIRPLLVIAASAALVGGLVAGGLVAWDHGQRLMLTHHARQALERRDWPNALNYLQDVLRRHPEDLQATRLMVALCKQASPRSYLEWLRRLQMLEPDNREVSLELAQLAFRTGQVELAEGLARGLAAQPGMGGPSHTLLALIEGARGRSAEALVHFQAARAAQPESSAYLANHAAYLATQPEAWAGPALAEILQEIRKRPGGELAALRLEAARAAALGRGEEALRLAASARRHPDHGLNEILLELNLRGDLAPATLPTALQAAWEEAQKQPSWRIPLLEWTASRRLWGQALHAVSSLPPEVQSSLHVRFIRLQCSLSAGLPPQALAASLEEEQWDEGDALRLAAAAEARLRAGEAAAATALRARALETAEQNAVQAFALLDLIEGWEGWDAEEERLLERLARVEVFRADALHALFRFHQRSGSAAKLLPIAAQVHRLQPEMMIFEGNWLALELLIHPASSKIHRAVEDFHRRHPQHPHALSLQAHALVLRGRAEEGAALFETIDPSLRARPPIQLYYAHALARSGRSGEARRTLAGLDPGPLLDAERALLAAVQAALR